MPLISDYYRLNGFFNEAEVDGQEIQDQDAPPADYTLTGDEGAASAEQPTPQEGQNPPAESQPPEEGAQSPEEGGGEVPAEEPTDYTAATGEEPSTEEGGGEAPSPEEEAPVDELKTQEEEMYSNLTPEQLDVKHKELKTRFLDMYDMTTELVDRIGDVVVTEENIGVIEYVSKNLNNLRTMLSDYVSSIYSTKSYIENSINYNRFLAVLNGINKMLEQIPEKEEE